VLENSIIYAIKKLQSGGTVAFPTETVYGLGAIASNPVACANVFTIKGRPSNHPVIIHIHSHLQLTQYAKDICPLAYKLAETFWPGPLTLLLPKKDSVHPVITGGSELVALRVPDQLLTLKLLQELNTGIIGPSANTYGGISPTTARHVRKDLGDKVDLVLDGGSCRVGIESTIVGFASGQPVIHRTGSITAGMIAKTLGIKRVATTISSSAPGSKKSHYAPKNKLLLLEKAKVEATIKELLNNKKRYSLLGLEINPIDNECTHFIQGKSKPHDYARELYSNLHTLDLYSSTIIVEQPPATEQWFAIRDRLSRAAAEKEVLELKES